ncbi:RIP metalloprotease RseP [Gorillibacterium sp. sgz500922]|uniref:RIP metalloprotease RseP n=1 Tax=Gorillibacterium sp. sgz500922 TaxID=3446694 RepID=UPI003F66E14C
MHSIEIGLQIILMFFVLVSLHEFGHMFFAKRAGILVREFAIGFGPKLFSYKRGETRYTLRLLPIGGFARMAGEDPEILQVATGQTVGVRLQNGKIAQLFTDRFERLPNLLVGEIEDFDLEDRLFVTLKVDGETHRFDVLPKAEVVSEGKETQIAPKDRQFGSKTVFQRFLTILAGPVMNVLLAFVLFLIYTLAAGVPTHIKLGTIEAGSPAAQADLKQGDVILSVNGENIGSDSNRLVELIQNSAGEPVRLILNRGGEQIQKEVTPVKLGDTIRIGTALGFETRRTQAGEAITGAWNDMTYMTKQILVGFKKLVTGDFKMDDLAGPVGTVKFTAEIASAGVAPMIRWSALLSLYLAIFNLLPVPALDGSRLVFLLVEAVRGKPVDPNRESLVHFIGFAMLMLLMIAVTYNDILNLFQG